MKKKVLAVLIVGAVVVLVSKVLKRKPICSYCGGTGKCHSDYYPTMTGSLETVVYPCPKCSN